MGDQDDPTGAEGDVRFRTIVPPRVVLTELCRGFLLVNDLDRKRAARFAQGFLRERAGTPPERPLAGVPYFPARRRGPGPSDALTDADRGDL